MSKPPRLTLACWTNCGATAAAISPPCLVPGPTRPMPAISTLTSSAGARRATITSANSRMKAARPEKGQYYPVLPLRTLARAGVPPAIQGRGADPVPASGCVHQPLWLYPGKTSRKSGNQSHLSRLDSGSQIPQHIAAALFFAFQACASSVKGRMHACEVCIHIFVR
jgi:hypothetical protein